MTSSLNAQTSPTTQSDRERRLIEKQGESEVSSQHRAEDGHREDPPCCYFAEYIGTEKTALAALEAAMDLGDEALRGKCVQAEMLHRNADGTIASAWVLHLRKETLKGLLQEELRVTSETFLFDAILVWYFSSDCCAWFGSPAAVGDLSCPSEERSPRAVPRRRKSRVYWGKRGF